MSNPLLQPNMSHIKNLYNAMKSGNPSQIFQMMANNNPSMKPIMDMLNKGADPRDLFYKLCNQRGINPEEFIKNITG